MPQRGQPAQKQAPPGTEREMDPKPESENPNYKAAGKFKNKVVLITGGDRGIGKATAISFVKEGTDIASIYLMEDEDENETKKRIEEIGKKCLIIKGDIGKKAFCEEVVKKVIDTYGRIDILINNAGEQHVKENLEDISEEQLTRTFRTNIFSLFFLTQAVLPYLKKGSAIVNIASVTAYQGREQLMDYASTKERL
jgi:NAD(P)-dependent dehydrogenase (short-subunit alcohol dehydrogenase family)